MKKIITPFEPGNKLDAIPEYKNDMSGNYCINDPLVLSDPKILADILNGQTKFSQEVYNEVYNTDPKLAVINNESGIIHKSLEELSKEELIDMVKKELTLVNNILDTAIVNAKDIPKEKIVGLMNKGDEVLKEIHAKKLSRDYGPDGIPKDKIMGLMGKEEEDHMKDIYYTKNFLQDEELADPIMEPLSELSLSNSFKVIKKMTTLIQLRNQSQELVTERNLEIINEVLGRYLNKL